MTDTQERGGGLTERQIKWCRDWIPSFSDAWKRLKAADEHAAKVREKMERAA